MMNEVIIINEQEVLGKQFKIYGTFEEPLFLAKDVAEWIEYSKTSKGAYNISKMLTNIDDDEKLILQLVIPGDTQVRSHSFLTEDGLYEVLMQSRKPIAKQFKKEVKKILKALRTGKAKLVPQLSAEDRAIVEIIHQVKAGNVPQAVGTVLEYGQEKYDEGYGKGQNDKEEELQPVIEFAEVFEKADGKLRVREAAKLVYDKDRINVGERKLHALLRYWGWELYNGSSTTEPSQNAIKAGWLIAKPITRYNKDSNRYHVTYTPYVTPKGLALITKKLLKMSTSDVNQIYKEDKIKMKKFKVNLK